MITNIVLAEAVSKVQRLTFDQGQPLIEHLHDEQPVLVSFIVSLQEVGADVHPKMHR